MVRRLAIRLGPDLIETLRARRLARIAEGRDDCDRFTPATQAINRCAQPYRPPGVTPQVSRTEETLREQAAARAEHDLAIARNRLAKARIDLAGTESAALLIDHDVAVSYGIRWMPESGREPGAPTEVIHVPGVVRAYVAPTGRLIDVLM